MRSRRFPISGNNTLAAVLLLCISCGCTSYHPLPITHKATAQQLQTPPQQQLQVRASAIQHPYIAPLALDLQDGLSPDEAAVLAVLRNPDLRALRDKLKLADAQVLQAGLLPDPQLSYGFTAPSGGTDLGMNNAYGIGLNWQVSALLWRRNQINAAEKQRQDIDLQIAWQEWQTAQAARSAVYQLLVYTQQHALLKEMASRLEENRARLQQAADEGLVTELERVAAVSAKNLIDVRTLALEQLVKQQRQRLNRAMGLKPHESIDLQTDISLMTDEKLPAYDELLEGLEDRRLDLLALQRGYQSQDELVHVAVLQQFPKISIGFDHARDNSNLYTLGFGVTMTLPLFNRNQGSIAMARATRQQLFDQYSARVFQARADIAELLVTIASLNRQIASIHLAIPALSELVNAYGSAIQLGQVDVLNYYTAWNNLTNKKIDLLTLELKVRQAEIALDIASGCYRPQPIDHGKSS